MKYRIEILNLDGQGDKPWRVYDMPSASSDDYWLSITDVPCPADRCSGVIRWHEAGYVPAYRKCDQCGRHFIGRGNPDAPSLVLMGARRGRA